MQSESDKRKLSELEQMKADIAQQELALEEQKKEFQRLEKKQKVDAELEKCLEQLQQLQQQAAQLNQPVAAKAPVSTNTERCIAGSASLKPATVAALVGAPAKRPGWPALTKALQHKARPPRTNDIRGGAWLGDGYFFEINCRMKKDDPECAGPHCHAKAHDREIWSEENPHGNVVREDNGCQWHRRCPPTVTVKRRQELQKTAEQYVAQHEKKQRKQNRAVLQKSGAAEDVINSPKQSAANGGAAVSAAGGASASRPAISFSRARGGKRAVGAPRKCPKNQNPKAQQIALLVTKYRPMSEEKAKNEIEKAKRIPCNTCYYTYLNDVRFETKPTQHKSVEDYVNKHGFMDMVPSGSGWLWKCKRCQDPGMYPPNDNTLQAFQQLKYAIDTKIINQNVDM